MANKEKIDKNSKRYDVRKMEQEEINSEFQLQLQNRFQALEEREKALEVDVKTLWKEIKEGYNETAENVLGFKNTNRKDWLSETTWKLIEERKQVHDRLISCRIRKKKAKYQELYESKNKEVKRSARMDKRKWISDVAEAAESAAKRGDWQLYQTTRTLTKRKTLRNQPIRTKQGNLITNKKNIMKTL